MYNSGSQNSCVKALERITDWDSRVHLTFEHHRFDYADSFFSAITGLGSVYFALALVTGLHLARFPGSVNLATGIVALWAVVFPLKYTFDRPKPKDSPLAVDVTPSFPSGHSATSVFLAIRLSSLLPELAPLLFFLTGTVCLSRVYLGAHYPSDVLAGASIGAVAAVLL